MKILHMECGGLVIYHLRIEEGFFHLLAIDMDEGRTKAVETFWNEQVLLVQGIDTTKAKRHKRWNPGSWIFNILQHYDYCVFAWKSLSWCHN